MIKGTRIVALVTAVIGMACVWDSDTLHDEMQTEADTFDLITGQFPHHGKAYYEARITRTLARLERIPGNRNLRNDLASAYLRVERFEDALREFEALRKEKPGEYKTLSNLGVLHKKMGNYARAFEYTAQALEIKPEGHLGLGDWYLKMLRFRRDRCSLHCSSDLPRACPRTWQSVPMIICVTSGPRVQATGMGRRSLTCCSAWT